MTGDDGVCASFSGFGYAVEDRGDPDELDSMLQAVEDAGFTHADIDAGLWDALLGGGVNGRQLARFGSVIERHRDRLRFTMHGANDLNVFDWADRDVQERLFCSSVELARALGAEAIAYHPGVRLPPTAGAAVPMTELMGYERDLLLAVADEIGAWGGRIGIETWWCDDRGTNPHYSYAVWPEQLAQQVEAIDHPAVGVCLDFGHLYIAARWFGFDFLDGVARLAPLVNHFHLHDNFGAPGLPGPVGSAELGRGDLHLPPGWGTIPFDEIFSKTSFPQLPVFNIELVRGRKTRLLPYLPEMLAECRRLASLVPVEALVGGSA